MRIESIFSSQRQSKSTYFLKCHTCSNFFFFLIRLIYSHSTNITSRCISQNICSLAKLRQVYSMFHWVKKHRVLPSWTLSSRHQRYILSRLLWLLWPYPCSDLVHCADMKVSAVWHIPPTEVYLSYYIKKWPWHPLVTPQFSLRSHIPAATTVKHNCLYS